MGTDSTLVRRLKAARKAAGISQKNLGILAGIDEFVASARINQYERGKHEPDQATVARLAAVLKVPVSFLYEPDDDVAALIRIGGSLPKTRLRALVKRLEKEAAQS
jgi:transcriptional regulator with XRE-family HTH domain